MNCIHPKWQWTASILAAAMLVLLPVICDRAHPHFINIDGKINRTLFGSNGSQPASRFVRSALGDSSYTAHARHTTAWFLKRPSESRLTDRRLSMSVK